MSSPVPPPAPEAPAVAEGICLRRVARNGAISFLAVALSSALGLAAVVVLARGLGRDALGEYYVVFALMTTVQLVTEFGLSTLLTPRILAAPAAWKDVVAEAMGLLVLVCLLSVLGVLGAAVAWAAWRGGSPLWPAFAAAAVACAGLQVQQFAAGVFRALERFEYEAAGRVLQGVLFVALAALFVRRGPGALDTALAALAASHVAAALYMLAGLHWGWRCLGLRVRWRSAAGWLAASVPLALGDFFRRLTMQIDTVLLSLLQGSAAAVGIYSLACRPVAGLTVLPRLLLWVTFPAFVRLAGGEREVMARAFARCTRLLCVVSLPPAVLVCVYAGPIAVVLGGPEYRDAAAPIRILIWVLVLTFLSAQFRLVFTALGRQRLYVVLVGAVFVAETAAEAALIPAWSYLGLCAGFVAGEALYVAAGLVLFHRLGLRGIEWGRLARAAAGAAVLGVATWPARSLPVPLFALVAAAAAAAYYAYCRLAGAILPDEGKWLATAALGVLRLGRLRPAGGRVSPGPPGDGPAPALAGRAPPRPRGDGPG